MSTIYQKLISNNKEWANRKRKEDPGFFIGENKRGNPQIMWIGCSDSQIAAHEVIGTYDVEMYVHRNLANMVIHSDLNFLTALDYAINILRVEHIIICGHYGCKGIKAAMEKTEYGLSENWIQFIRDVYQMHRSELDKIADFKTRYRRFVELNVIQQMIDVTKTTVFKNALKDGKPIELHGWVYNSQSGNVVELGSLFGS